jgi:hypothetical protein
LSEVKAIAQKVLIIHRGKIAAHDAIEKLGSLEETFIQLTAA